MRGDEVDAHRATSSGRDEVPEGTDGTTSRHRSRGAKAEGDRNEKRLSARFSVA
jgi:hypothetical protein